MGNKLQFAVRRISKILKKAWSSYKERRVNALALGADERRDKLR